MIDLTLDDWISGTFGRSRYLPTPATDVVLLPVRPRAVATVAVPGLDLQQWPYIVVCSEELAVVAPVMVTAGLARVVAGVGVALVEKDLEVVLVMVYTLAFAKLSSHSSLHQPTEFQRLA